MIFGLRKIGRLRRCFIGLLLAGIVVAVSGCQTFTFYSQAFKGQYQIFAHQEATARLRAESQTPATLKERLELVEQLRAFASSNLALPVDGHYLKYVDLHRPFVVWNVEAAREFSLEPKTWWYPMVGSLAYRGYFSKEGAQRYAARFKNNGYDVFVGGVEAYSTLGWFKDPLLNTFIFNPDAELAETLFHELAHQQVFARGDTDFNEAFATTVGQEGARRWLRSTRSVDACAAYAAQLERTRQFVHLIMGARLKLEQLYGDTRDEDGKIKAAKKQPPSPEEMRRDKQQIMTQLQEDYKMVKAQWGGDGEYDDWFARPLNNAQLNSVAAYYDLVPAFERLLQINNGDLAKFYEAADQLAKLTKKDRQQQLRSLGQASVPTVDTRAGI